MGEANVDSMKCILEYLSCTGRRRIAVRAMQSGPQALASPVWRVPDFLAG